MQRQAIGSLLWRFAAECVGGGVAPRVGAEVFR